MIVYYSLLEPTKLADYVVLTAGLDLSVIIIIYRLIWWRYLDSFNRASRCVDRLRNLSGSWIKETGSRSELENIRVRLQNSSRVHIEQHSTRMVHWLFILIHYSGRFFVSITIECNFSRFPFSFNPFNDHSLDTFRSCVSYRLMWVSFILFDIINSGVCKECYSDAQYRI